ncbi:outer membrane receptor for ferrienterochelin and colicins [Chthonomonas calidirosea]|uniref:Outer membrane receptor for ferrienterochelin and colicins n=1 Tax=Chthonomonas calidirosea (strain DSM 23976 / ICMP 18418 / T49) TaxID=1303518 RepID=S0F026_CHTCT|nr:TonB-dependent receptor [Chthonomonas calidirosea]CCW36387.1 Outer membrane receptor for ferrienterochelin and colicins [Chthonomonas calidirosea T49]CEK17484.1 outer membrane receptor for ferrienterochelin and colicins [Chthonomonas calidirosea]
MRKSWKSLSSGVLALVLNLTVRSGHCLEAKLGPANSQENELLFAGKLDVVSASRTKQPLDQAPADVTVITADQIERSGAVTLLDVLRYVPGLNVSESNATVASVSLRGLNSLLTNTLLVMIDGRPVNQDVSGGVTWDFLPLALLQIQRIEIVRGPGSTLYGANAFNGVINIITKTPQEQLEGARNRLQFRTVVGGYKSDYDELLASAADRHGSAISLSFAYNHSGGYGSAGKMGVWDSYATPLINLDFNHQNRHAEYRLQAGTVASSENVYQNIFLQGAHFYQSYITFHYGEPRAQDPLTVRGSYNNYSETAQNVDYTRHYVFEGEIQKQNTFNGRNTLVYGMSLRHVYFHSGIATPGRHNQNLFGFYAQDEAKLGKGWIAYAGLRYDDDSLVGSRISPRLTVIKDLGARQTLRLTYGTSYQIPSLITSYASFAVPIAPMVNEGVVGNTHLASIRLQGGEIDWRKGFSNGFVGIDIYYNNIRKLIGPAPLTFFPSPPFPPGTPSSVTFANNGGARTYGFEVESELQLAKHMHALFNYSFANQHFDDSSVAGFFQPNHMLNIGLDMGPIRRWEVFLGTHLVGAVSAIIGDGGFYTAPAYIRTDLRIGYRLREGKEPLTIAFIVHNLFDDHHIEFPFDDDSPLPAQVAPQRTNLYLEISGKF